MAAGEALTGRAAAEGLLDELRADGRPPDDLLLDVRRSQRALATDCHIVLLVMYAESSPPVHPMIGNIVPGLE